MNTTKTPHPIIYIAGIIGILMILSVFWNIVMPSDWCWLGFWKGLGTLVLGVVLVFAAGEVLEKAEKDGNQGV